MRKLEKQAIKEIINGYYTDEELLETIPRGVTGAEFIEGGGLAVYYNETEEDLRAVYGDDFERDVYFTKTGELRTKGGEVYLWTIYKGKFGAVVDEILER